MDEGEGVFERDQFYHKKPADEHIQNLLIFVQSHEALLADLQSSTRDAIADASLSHYRPIRVSLEPTERVLPGDIISSDNEDLRKILSVLLYNCDEAQELMNTAESNFFGSLAMFGQMPLQIAGREHAEERTGTGYREKMIGKMLPTLQEIANFVDRCHAVVLNLVQQLASLHDPKLPAYARTFQKTHLQSAFAALGNILRLLQIFDTIVDGNTPLTDAWGAYKLMIAFVRADQSTFDTNEAKISQFERLLVSLDDPLMSGNSFSSCIEQNFEEIQEEDEVIQLNVQGNNVFLGELLFYIKKRLDESLASIGSNSEMNEKEHIMSCFCLYALYRRLVPRHVPPDPKLYKAFWLVQKTVPFVVICDNYLWLPPDFLQKYVSMPSQPNLDPPNALAFRKLYMEKFVQLFPNRATLAVAQCTAWFILVESKFQPSIRYEASTVQALETRSSVLFKGACLATRISSLIKTCLVAHVVMELPLSKTLLAHLAQLIEILKGIEFTFKRKDAIIAEAQVHCLRLFSISMLEFLGPLRNKFQSVRKVEDSRMDLLSAIDILEETLAGSESFSPLRQQLASILVELLVNSSLTEEKDALKIISMLKRILLLANMTSTLRKACDTSFLYFHSHLLPVIVSGVYLEPTSANRLQYIAGAFCDAIKLCEFVRHAEQAPYVLNLRKNIYEVIKAEIIEPLSRDIETDLRLNIHIKHLDHMQSVNPKTADMKPLRPFIDLPPIRVLGLLIDIKKEVTHYLDRNFYNLTTVALHDWHTYAEMRSLAAEKLGVHLLDNFLPMGSLDQGLDVLQIMRNIHVFVARFTYNMNMQEFVEFKPDKNSKHLNTIKIQSIASSIRQHGLGMLNTTVNFTYQFLAQQFHIFTEFLFDENIRSPLSKEHRWYRKHKADADVNNMYPYERAAKFVKDVRRLGVSADGMSFLDQFRVLITRIGNALGYVRMVRSASMHYCSEAVKFLPELDDTISFEHYSKNGLSLIVDGVEVEAVKEDGTSSTTLSPETIRAGKNLDDVIRTLIKNFGEGSDFFKILVAVFQDTLNTETHDHLKYFYAIVPALCISWVDASLQAKDAMAKIVRGASAREMYFTDDGFAMGIAYCLAILKQSGKYGSLNWQESVRKYQGDEMSKVQDLQRIRAAKEEAIKLKNKRKSSIIGSIMSLGRTKEEEDDADEQDLQEFQTLQVSAKRLEAQRRESEQLFFSISGAEIFFRRNNL